MQLDDEEEESLVDAEDLNPSDEEDFVELENQAWDNSEMKNWSDFEKVRDELVKITEERKTNLMETDVQKTESEVELEAIWGVEKMSKQRRKRTRAHASKASVNNLRASRYVDLTNMKLILTDGVQSGTGLPIEDFQGTDDVSKVKDADVVEALSQVSLDEDDTETSGQETSDQEEEKDDTPPKIKEIIHGDVIEILSSGEDANERGQESEDIPDTEDDEESLGESDSEEETLEDPAEHDSIQCGEIPDDEQDTLTEIQVSRDFVSFTEKNTVQVLTLKDL